MPTSVNSNVMAISEISLIMQLILNLIELSLIYLIFITFHDKIKPIVRLCVFFGDLCYRRDIFRLPLTKSILLILCFSKGFDYSQVKAECKLSDKAISDKTISNWYSYCRESNNSFRFFISRGIVRYGVLVAM